VLAVVQLLDLVIHAEGRLIRVHLDLFDDDLLLHVEVFDAETRPHDVGQQIDARLLILR
jgi:hypothetical protein